MKYRKKPAIVQAVQWFPGRDVVGVIAPDPDSTTQFEPFLQTSAGPIKVTPGDWIITDSEGRRYPCTAETFAATYEQEAEDVN